MANCDQSGLNQTSACRTTARSGSRDNVGGRIERWDLGAPFWQNAPVLVQQLIVSRIPIWIGEDRAGGPDHVGRFT